MEEIKDEIDNKKFSQLLSDGFKLFSKNYKILFLTWLVFTLIYNILFVFLLTDIRYLYYNNALPRVLYLIIFFIISGTLGIIGVIPVCSLSSYLFKKYTNLTVDFKEEFKKAINYRIKYPIFIYLVLFIIFGVIFDLLQDFFLESLFLTGTSVVWIMILTQIISIPVVFISLILTSLYIFVRYTYNIEDIERPIYEARSLTKGIFWKIFGVLIINMIILWIFFTIYMVISQYMMIIFFQDLYLEMVEAQIRNYGFILLYNLIFDIPTIFLGPLKICLITPFFTHQYLKRVNKNLK